MQRASRPNADQARGHFGRIPLGRAAFLRCVRCSTLDDAVHRFGAKRLLSGENRSRRGRRDFFSSLLRRRFAGRCRPRPGAEGRSSGPRSSPRCPADTKPRAHAAAAAGHSIAAAPNQELLGTLQSEVAENPFLEMADGGLRPVPTPPAAPVAPRESEEAPTLAPASPSSTGDKVGQWDQPRGDRARPAAASASSGRRPARHRGAVRQPPTLREELADSWARSRLSPSTASWRSS